MKATKNEIVIWRNGQAFHAWRERGAPTIIASFAHLRNKAEAEAYAASNGMEFREETK